jgi:S-sulfo-L-cysteine synthase (O-acetyl-L-serine-dependent)
MEMSTTTVPVGMQATISVPTLEDRVGATPLIELRKVTAGLPAQVRILAKAEWFNPSGSIKDRPALSIIRAGVRAGQLSGGRRLLDSTSGNMGIAYATFCAARGIPTTLCVPENASTERLKILRALGAEIVLTDASEGSDGSMRVARSMADGDPSRYWYANQYDNPANWEAHFNSTGPEIAAQTRGLVTHLVVGVGTSGTLMGAGRYLRRQVPGVQIVAAEPATALHGLEGLKHMPTAARPAIFDPHLADRVIRIDTEAAHDMVRELAAGEGLFVGISSGAAAVAALRAASELRTGIVVTVFPDAGFKYLSDSALWGENDSRGVG